MALTPEVLTLKFGTIENAKRHIKSLIAEVRAINDEKQATLSPHLAPTQWLADAIDATEPRENG